MSKNYYEILGVSKTASEDELKKAYRTLSKKYHPDLQQGRSDSEKKSAEEKFKEINEAYSVLGDKEKRQKYDTFGTSDMSGSGPGGFDPMSFFRRHFGSNFGGFEFGFGDGGSKRRSKRDPNAPRDGRDVEIGLEITFEESIFGTNRKFDIKFNEVCSHCNGTCSDDGSVVECDMCGGSGEYSQQIGSMSFMRTTCPKCHGSGSFPKNQCHVCNGSGVSPVNHHINILIPSGIDSGERLRIPGEGEHGINGGHSGDLYITVSVGDCELFKRSGENLATLVYMPSIAVGIQKDIEVSTPYGTKKIKIPSKLDSDGVFRTKISGCGVKRKYKGREIVGDLYVTIVPEPITSLSDEQKKLAKKLLDSLNGSNMSDAKKSYDAAVKVFEHNASMLKK